MNNSDMPAGVCPDVHHENGQIEYGCSGLTKREHFAGLAMQAILSNKHFEVKWWPDEVKAQSFAEASCAYADALLAALEQEQAK